eukprot:2965250-Pyramimonas_sp.AAC.1
MASGFARVCARARVASAGGVHFGRGLISHPLFTKNATSLGQRNEVWAVEWAGARAMRCDVHVTQKRQPLNRVADSRACASTTQSTHGSQLELTYVSFAPTIFADALA